MRIPIPFTNRVIEFRSGLANPEKWLRDALLEPSRTGISVTPETAMRSSAVFACVRVLAEAVSSLPLHLYRRLENGGKERATDHPLHDLLHRQPNPEMTSIELRETLMGHLVLRGNAYAELVRDQDGAVRAVWPLRPDHMKMLRTPEGSSEYHYRLPGGGQAVLSRRQVLHLRTLSNDGFIGMSPIQMAREAIGLSLAAEEFGARLFSQGSRPGGVLEHPGRLSLEAHSRLRDSWEAVHSGLSGAHRVAILEEGIKWHQVGLAPEDAQFIEARRFQIAEIARIFRVPLHLVAETDKAATYASVEQFQLQFVVHTLLPWLVRWEQAISRDIILPGERGALFAEHLVAGLLRGDMDSRYRAYATGRNWGWLSADDVRALENMNPLPDGQGQTYLIPLNMTVADAAGVPVPIGAEAASLLRRDNGGYRRRPVIEAEGSRAVAPIADRPRFRRPEQFYPSILSAATRLVRWEAAELRALAERYLVHSSDLPAFIAGLERFLEDGATTERMAMYIYPSIFSYAAVVADDVEREIEGSLPEDWAERNADGYSTIFVRDHLGDSQGQLEALAQAEAPDVTVPKRLEEWVERRPGKIASWESVLAAGVFSRCAMRDLGVTRLRWYASGPEPCPFCSRLNGSVVGVGSPFALGEAPAEGELPMRLHRNPRNPPLHEGCVCSILPEVGG